MKIESQVVDRSAEALTRFENASRLGVDAAANTIQVAVTRAHDSTYYKGGAFRGTLYVRQSIRRTDPVREIAGKTGWVSFVGTKIIQALYWELGHWNLFTRAWERREIWVPAARAAAQAARDAYGRVVARLMGGEAAA